MGIIQMITETYESRRLLANGMVKKHGMVKETRFFLSIILHPSHSSIRNYQQ